MNPPSFPSFFSFLPAAARSAAAFCRGLRGRGGRDLRDRSGGIRGLGRGNVGGFGLLGCGHDGASSCGSESHDKLEIGVDEIGPAGMAGDFFTDNGDARRSTDEQDARERRLIDTGRDDCTVEGAERVDDARAHGRFELVTRDAHLGVQAGDGDRDGRLGVVRQRFLRVDAVGSELDERAPDLGIGAVEFAEAAVERVVHVRQHHLIEIDATQALEPFRWPEQDRAVLGALHDRGVERPAAEVVHGDDVADRDTTEADVVQRGRARLRKQASPRPRRRAGPLRAADRACTRPTSRGA